MSFNSGTIDGILIRVMTMEDYRKIEDTVYDEEPLRSGTENDSKVETQQSLIDGWKKYHNSLVEEGTCLVAINKEDGGRIVGSVLAGSETFSDLQEKHAIVSALDDCVIKTIAMFEFETKIRVNYFSHYGVSKALYLQMINVNASMRGKGLGTRLTAALMELGRSKALPIMTACCTSFYSARQMEAMGMECIYNHKYTDYKDANGQVVFHPPAPHTQLRVLAIKL